MFAFSQVEPNRTWEMTHWDIPVSRWLSTKFEAGLEYRAGEAVSRFTEDMIADGPEISQELANKEWGIPGHLQFDGPINNQRAALMHERKRKELELSGKLEMADHSWASWKGVAGFGAMMVGGVAHPLDAALMFLPVVGNAAKAKAAALAGRGVFRQALVKGLITEEALARFTAFPEFGAAVIDGTIGNALAEIPVFVQKTRDQADYGVADAAINIAGGGVFAGALHLGFRGLARAFDRLSPEIKDHMLQHETDAFLKSETPDTAKIAAVDEAAIAARVEEDLRVEAESIRTTTKLITSKGSTYELFPDNTTVRNKSFHPEHGAGDVGVKQRSERTYFVSKDDAVKLAEIQAQGGVKRVVAELSDGRIGVKYLEGGSAGKFEARTVVAPKQKPEIGDVPVELWDGGANVHFGNKITEVQHGLSPYNESHLANERERRIREYIDSRKPERIAAAKAAELQAQQAQGKILSQEQIKEFTLASDEQAATAIKADAANIEANLKSELQSKLLDEALTPEQKEALQAELDEALGQIDEGLADQTKAIEQAKNCLLQNG